MERNVLSWKACLEKGYEPRLYPFNLDNIPAGIYNARLDFKIWAKKTMAVVCYFTLMDTGQKCCLSVFRTKGDEQYILPGGDIDFATCPIEIIYRISITYNAKGKPVIKEAEFL
jgi:hypothetical protein